MNETTGHRPILARKGAPALVIKAGPAAVSWVARRTASTRRTKWLPSLRVSFQSRAIPDRSVTRIGDDAVSPRSLRSGIMSNKPAENGRAGHRRLMRLVRQADRKFATPPMRVLVEAGLTPRAFVRDHWTTDRAGPAHPGGQRARWRHVLARGPAGPRGRLRAQSPGTATGPGQGGLDVALGDRPRAAR